MPLVVDFSSSVANSRSRVVRKSICAQEKVPTNLYECALGGARNSSKSSSGSSSSGKGVLCVFFSSGRFSVGYGKGFPMMCLRVGLHSVVVRCW